VVPSNQFAEHPFELCSPCGADDFDVPAILTKGWSVRVIRALGECGGCASETAVFYTDAPGKAGTEVAERSGLGDWNNGTYALTFSSPVQLTGTRSTGSASTVRRPGRLVGTGQTRRSCTGTLPSGRTQRLHKRLPHVGEHEQL
jgi:hypothetical protein